MHEADISFALNPPSLFLLRVILGSAHFKTPLLELTSLENTPLALF